MDFPRESDYAEIGIREIVSSPGSRITPTVARTPGTDANILVHSSAAMADEVTGQLVDLEAGSFLDSCKGQKLDRYLWDRYRLKRPGATPALNSVLFYTSVAAPASFLIAAGQRVSTPDGIDYVTTADAMYPKGATSGVFVPARSVLAGASQRSAGGVVLSIQGAISGAPADLRAMFSVASSGGDDGLSDDEFRALGRSFFANATLGVLSAIEARAKRVDGVLTARAFEDLSQTGRPERFVRLVISDRYTDAYAKLDVVPPTYQTQSALLAATVQSAVRDTRGGGTQVLVTMGQVIMMSIAMDLRFLAGVDYNAVAFAARLAIFRYTNALAGGQPWVYDDARRVLSAVNGLAFGGDEIRSPIGDVIPRPLEVIRSDMRLVSANSTAPDQVLGAP